MDLNSREDVDTYVEIQTSNQLHNIEKKIKRLSYEPVWIFLSVIAYAFSIVWLESESLLFSLIVLAGILTSLSRNNVERCELIRQLNDIKYGNR